MQSLIYYAVGLAPYIAARLPLAEAQEAHRLMEARQVTGKLLLIPVHEQA